MLVIKKLWFLSLINILLIFITFLVPVMAGKQVGTNENLINDGKKKAKEMGLNPIPVYADEKGELIIVPGTMFSIQNNKWVIKDGDMLINVGNSPVSAGDIILKKGEYATVQNGKITKQPDSLLSNTKLNKSEANPKSKSNENSVNDIKRTNVEIKGSIINFSEASKYMTKESYFQIVKIPENRKLNGFFDSKGRIKVNSEHPKLNITKNGTFNSNLLNLEPGDYTIVPQLFSPGVYQTSNLVVTNAKKLLKEN